MSKSSKKRKHQRRRAHPDSVRRRDGYSSRKMVIDEVVDLMPASELEEMMKSDMLKVLQKRYLEEVIGPNLYGEGNFEVFQDKAGEWDIRTVEGYVPAEPRGIVID